MAGERFKADWSLGPFWGSHKARWLIGLLVVMLTVIVFHRVPRLGWTNWDDGVYVYENQAVREGDYKKCLTEPVNGAYTPLPQLTFALEWQLVRPANPTALPDARLFHIDNLILHLITVGLVYLLGIGLGLQPVWAGMMALIWGIHPLRVESVAWVTERKDVLMGVFYAGAMVLYLRYLRSMKLVWMAGVLICFLLACLSKVQAVTLPAALLLLDWFKGREWNWRWVWEKAPQFIGSIAFGLIGMGIAAIDEGMPVPDVDPGIGQRLLLGLGSMGLYLVSQFVAVAHWRLPIHAVPVGPTLKLLLGLTVLVNAIALVVWKRPKSKPEAFALAFLILHLLPVVWSVKSTHAFQADRLAYLGSMGFWIGFGFAVQRLSGNKLLFWRIFSLTSFAFVLATQAIIAVMPWQDSESLWSHAIQAAPDEHYIPYINRGHLLLSKGDRNHAIIDFEHVIKHWPQNPLGYLHRGNAHMQGGNALQARADFDQAVRLYAPEATRPQDPELLLRAYKGRASANLALGKVNEALTDFGTVLRMSPSDAPTYRARASVRMQLGDPNAALPDLNEGLRLLPEDPGLLTLRGQCHLQLSHFDAAIQDLSTAIAQHPSDGYLYLNRAYAHQALGHGPQALQDFQQAQALGVLPQQRDSLP
ncbi:MAG: tetratricopeptide repeat protein [Bacteroidia bacterium]